jgi:hypothetical protein
MPYRVAGRPSHGGAAAEDLRQEERQEVRKNSPVGASREVTTNAAAVPQRVALDAYQVRSAIAKGKAKVLGVLHRHTELFSGHCRAERFLDPRKAPTYANVRVIGETARRDLYGPEGAVGRDVKINDLWCQVVGVAALFSKAWPSALWPASFTGRSPRRCANSTSRSPNGPWTRVWYGCPRALPRERRPRWWVGYWRKAGAPAGCSLASWGASPVSTRPPASPPSVPWKRPLPVGAEGWYGDGGTGAGGSYPARQLRDRAQESALTRNEAVRRMVELPPAEVGRRSSGARR